jgi:ABC-type uncharacterized transport system permease subunit
VEGSFNVIALLLVHTLPALSGWHREAVAVTAGFLLLADVIFLYLLFFKRAVSGGTRYRQFEDILVKPGPVRNRTPRNSNELTNVGRIAIDFVRYG